MSRLFNIEKNEQALVFILLLQSVFLGIFAGAFDVGAHSLFLKVFDASAIPGAFVISGIVGIIITSVYTRLQRRMRFSVFILLNLIFVALATLLLRFGFEYTTSDKLVYLVFVMMGPLTIISFLGFWGNVSRIFSLRQGKRLFGIIDTGQILGIILSSYAIPVMMSLKFAILDTLLIASASIFIALIIQIFISRKAHFREKVIVSGSGKSEKTGFFQLFKSKYTLLITLFVVFSVITAFFVHYSFISAVQMNYKEPENLASFLGAFMGTLMVFTIIIKTFLYGRLMKMYGLRFALLITPVLLGIFTLIVLIAGSLYGYKLGTAGFTMFFILLALSKLFVKSLKDSIEVPSAKILYQSLNPEVRYDVQARVDGTVNETAAFFSGLLLAGLGLIASITLFHYTGVLAIVIVLWGITGGLLYKAYRDSLYNALKRFREAETVISEAENTDMSFKDQLQGRPLYYSLRLLPQLWNGFLTKNVKVFLAYPDKRISEETLNLVNRLGITNEELLRFQTDDESVINTESAENKIADNDISLAEINILLNSGDRNSRERAIFLLSHSDERKLHTRLIPLYRDYDPFIRACAIRSTGFTGNKDVVHYLVDMLDDPLSYHVAFHAVVKTGHHALDSLENAFYKTGVSDKSLRRITKAISQIDSPARFTLLINKLDHSDIHVVYEALTGLTKAAYSPDETETRKLIMYLRKYVDIAARNFAILVSLKANMPQAEVTNAMDEEFREKIDLIFSLLSLAYDPQAIYHIRQNYESGTTEGIGFAIELLDLLIDDTINPFLFPLFEDNTDQEKIKKLQTEYPVEVQNLPVVLFTILNSHLIQAGYYSRVCALSELLNFDDITLGNDAAAQAFHPYAAIREAAFEIIEKFNPDILTDIKRRSEIELKQAGILINEEETKNEIKKIERLRESAAFSSLKRKYIPEFARSFKLSYLSSFKNKKIKECFHDGEVILIVNGSIIINKPKAGVIRLEKNDIFLVAELIDIFEENVILSSVGDIELMRMSEDSIRELLFDYFDKEPLDLIERFEILHQRTISNTN